MPTHVSKPTQVICVCPQVGAGRHVCVPSQVGTPGEVADLQVGPLPQVADPSQVLKPGQV
jgi:hypothetical protein